MSNSIEGPEDSILWKKNYNINDGANHGTDCKKCGFEITLAHCAESGCPWCARCGANAKKEK